MSFFCGLATDWFQVQTMLFFALDRFKGTICILRENFNFEQLLQMNNHKLCKTLFGRREHVTSLKELFQIKSSHKKLVSIIFHFWQVQNPRNSEFVF